MRIESALEHRCGAQRETRSPDRAIAALAARQHGVVARAQLVSAGLSRREIGRRLEVGRLHALYRGVYAVGHPLVSQRGRWMAAVLASGPGAVLSHRSAAALWGVRPGTGVEVTTARNRRARPGILLHQATIPPDELTTHDGIPTTTVARTLLDLAAVLPKHQLERAINEAERLRLTDPLPLVALIARHRNRRGLKALQSLQAEHGLGTAITKSELEARFLAFLDANHIPRPRTNHHVEGHECDCVWPAHRVIAELDGHATHATRRTYEQDRRKDRQLTTAGWRVVRITWRQLHTEPRALRADLEALLR